MPTAGRHLDRLTALDASFLTNETSAQPHARRRDPDLRGPAADATSTWSSTCEGGCTWCRASARSSSSRRWRPAGRSGSTTPTSTSPTTSATPRCRAPGGEEQLKRLAGARLLPAARPLQAALGDVAGPGLEGDRFALITKTHHALVDGISGVDIGTVLFDLEPVPEPADQRRRLGAAARAAPAELLRRGRDRRGRRRRSSSPSGPSSAVRRPEYAARRRRARRWRASARSSARSPTRRPTCR